MATKNSKTALILSQFWGSTQAVFACLYFSRGSRGSPHRWTQVSPDAADAPAPAISTVAMAPFPHELGIGTNKWKLKHIDEVQATFGAAPVSYTHLTLPTIRLV